MEIHMLELPNGGTMHTEAPSLTRGLPLTCTLVSTSTMLEQNNARIQSVEWNGEASDDTEQDLVTG